MTSRVTTWPIRGRELIGVRDLFKHMRYLNKAFLMMLRFKFCDGSKCVKMPSFYR